MIIAGFATETALNLGEATKGNLEPLARQGIKGIPTVGPYASSKALPYTGLTGIQEDSLKFLKAQGLPEETINVTKKFYKTVKSGPNKNKASEDINKAIAKGDQAKAQQIADEYNKELVEHLKKWAEESRGISLPQVLLESLQSALFTSIDFNERLRGISKNPSKYDLKIGGQ